MLIFKCAKTLIFEADITFDVIENVSGVRISGGLFSIIRNNWNNSGVACDIQQHNLYTFSRQVSHKAVKVNDDENCIVNDTFVAYGCSKNVQDTILRFAIPFIKGPVDNFGLFKNNKFCL